MSFHSLRDLLPKTANKFGLKGELQAALVLRLATDVIKELLPDHAASQLTPKRFSSGELWITSAHPVVAQELQLKSEQILTALNARLGQGLVKKLRSC